MHSPPIPGTGQRAKRTDRGAIYAASGEACCSEWSKAAAVILPPDALMMFSIVALEMFCPPRLMRDTDASLIGGSQRALNSAAVMPSLDRY